MDDNKMERGKSNMMGILGKIQKSKAQKHLLETTLTEHRLLKSRIMSSLQPEIGREFNYMKTWNLERKRN